MQSIHPRVPASIHLHVPRVNVPTILACLLWCLSSLVAHVPQAQTPPSIPNGPADGAGQPPNIVLIIGDDHGFPYFGFTGSEHVHTPHLDRLASEGATFLLAHVTANHCRPSLQTLITGLYPMQIRLRTDRYHAEAVEGDAARKALSDEERQQWDAFFYARALRFFTTLPTLLAEQGYTSFQAGKWWEHSYESGGFAEGMSQGWAMEEWGQPGWFRKFMGGEGMDLARETLQPVFDFIDRHTDRPFFLWYAPSLPHTPLNPPPEHYAHYANTTLSESAKEYYGNCTWFDAGVGDLVRHLEDRGLRENTLFVYVNDNGWEQPPFAEYRNDAILYANGGPRGKLSMHDLAFRTPIILYWPGRIEPKVFEWDLVSTVDIVPTLLDYAGLEPPTDLPGRSLRTIIEGSDGPERKHLIGHVTQLRSSDDVMGKPADGYYLRTQRWHFTWDVSEHVMRLYDMEANPEATENVIEEHPLVARRFQRAIHTWKARIASTAE